MNTPDFLIQNVKKYPNEPALSSKDKSGKWETDSWNDVNTSVMDVAKSLLYHNIGQDDKISIYSYNRKEWNYIYLATQFINSAAVGIYHTSSSNEVEWVAGNSESKIIFVGNNPNDNQENDKMPINRLLEAHLSSTMLSWW